MTNTHQSRSGLNSASSGSRKIGRAAPLMAAAAALLLAACSTTPEWTRPSTISDAITGQSPSEPTNETVAGQQAQAEAQSAASNFPTAGSTPEVPETGNIANKRDLADSLLADRQHARYSGEALRGGTEPPASPLPSLRTTPLPELPSVPAEQVVATQAGNVIPERAIPEFKAPTRRLGEVRDGEVVERAAEQVAAEVPAAPAAPTVEVAKLPAPAVAAPAAPAATPAPVASAPVARVAPVQQQATAAPTRRAAVPQRAVPTYETETRQAAAAAAKAASAPVARAVTPVTASGQPQFAQSSAPPLPAEVRAQVPAVVSARFDETGSAPVAASTTTAPAQLNVPAAQQGADGVVIDYSAIGAGSPVPNAEDLEQGSTPSLPVQQFEQLEFSGASSAAEGGPFTPVAVYFSHGSSGLNAADRSQISEVAALQKKRGGGTVRVVGHASSRTSNLPVEAHLLANFDMSLKRANVVAAELMRQGVAAADLVIEAEGDHAPVFYESMPAGEAGNRRAEIFLE